VSPSASYRELVPAPALAAHVSSLWIHHVPHGAAPHTHRSVPNGSVELVLRAGAVPRICGPQTRPRVEVLEPGATVLGARLRPGAAPSLVGVAGSELADAELGADEVWGQEALELGERAALAGSPGTGLAVVQAHLAARIAAAPSPDPLVAEAVRRLLGSAAPGVGELPSALGISPRQLRRRCHEAIGLGPKTMQRVLRFQRLLARVQFDLARGRTPAGEGLARVAADAGYADQAHLTRECVRLTGLPPRAFLDRTERACGPGHDHAASYLPLLRAAAPR
jgi:AraC-like DNA-binding protein